MPTAATIRARSLRRNETAAEPKLWLKLRDRRLGDHKFVRQWPVGPDFASREAKLIIEAALDGKLEPFDRYSLPSSSLSGTFSSLGRRRPLDEGPHDSRVAPSPLRGEGPQSGDEGSTFMPADPRTMQ